MIAAQTKVADLKLARIWAVVAALPRGRVSTYGAVAAAAGLPGAGDLDALVWGPPR